jgi:UDP-glucuronate 4-epimerase
LKILITGGAGFIGSHVSEVLLARDDQVVCVDNFNDYYDPARKHRNVAAFLGHPAYQLVKADIRAPAEGLADLFAAQKFDKVLHIAAMAGVRYSIEHPDLYAAVNVSGTINMLELACRHGVRNFVFASSSSVYGARSQAPFREEDAAEQPISPYAATKRAAELLTFTYHHLYGLPCTSLRFFTVYGPAGRPDMAPYLFTRWIFEGSELKMFGDGTSRRDYTYVDDIVAGVVAALDADLPFEIINLGNSRTVALNEFVAVVEQCVGRKARILRYEPQAGDVPLTSADISRAQRLLGFQPKVGIEEGMARFVDWYRREVLDH